MRGLFVCNNSYMLYNFFRCDLRGEWDFCQNECYGPLDYPIDIARDCFDRVVSFDALNIDDYDCLCISVFATEYKHREDKKAMIRAAVNSKKVYYIEEGAGEYDAKYVERYKKGQVRFLNRPECADPYDGETRRFTDNISYGPEKLRLFYLSLCEFNKANEILFTGPLEEDYGTCMRPVMENFLSEHPNIIVKAHPRDRFPYQRKFDKSIPAEFLTEIFEGVHYYNYHPSTVMCFSKNRKNVVLTMPNILIDTSLDKRFDLWYKTEPLI